MVPVKSRRRQPIPFAAMPPEIQRCMRVTQSHTLGQLAQAARRNLGTFSRRRAQGKRILTDQEIDDLAERYHYEPRWVRTGEGPERSPAFQALDPVLREIHELAEHLSPARREIFKSCGHYLLTDPQIAQVIETYILAFNNSLPFARELRARRKGGS